MAFSSKDKDLRLDLEMLNEIIKIKYVCREHVTTIHYNVDLVVRISKNIKQLQKISIHLTKLLIFRIMFLLVDFVPTVREETTCKCQSCSNSLIVSLRIWMRRKPRFEGFELDVLSIFLDRAFAERKSFIIAFPNRNSSI